MSTATEAVPSYPGLPAGRWLDVDGLQTWYTDAGSGVPIVFVYGGNFGTPESAPGAYAWDQNFEFLARRFRLIVFDKPGQGYTPGPREDGSFTMSFVVGHVIRLIETLGLPPVHIVGHSRGGYIATRATLLRPDLIRSLTIINSGTLSPGIGTNEVVLGRVPHPPYTRESVRWVYENYCHDPRSVTEEWVDRSMEILGLDSYRETVDRARVGRLIPKLFLPELQRDKTDTLAQIAGGLLQRPTQIIWGRNDRTARVARGYELLENISRFEKRVVLNVVDKCGHFPYREHPEWFNHTLAGFVERAGYDK